MTSFPIDFSFLALLSLEAADKRESISRGLMSLYWVSEGVDHEKRLRNGALDKAYTAGFSLCDFFPTILNSFIPPYTENKLFPPTILFRFEIKSQLIEWYSHMN